MRGSKPPQSARPRFTPSNCANSPLRPRGPKFGPPSGGRGTTQSVKLWPWLTTAVVGTAAYAALVEANNLTPVRRTLRLAHWPPELDGFTIGLLADLHIRDKQTIILTRAAISWLRDQRPDIVLIPGDLAENHPCDHLAMLDFALEEIRAIGAPIFAVSGNHDYEFGLTPDHLLPVLEKHSVRLLDNESVVVNDVQVVGMASGNAGAADPAQAVQNVDPAEPTVIMWHEPDLVDRLPIRADLMLAGHSHGGQFGLPNGWTPCKTRNGRKYYRGWYPDAPTPLYVSRGLATTWLPMRLFCPPEVTLLTVRSAYS